MHNVLLLVASIGLVAPGDRPGGDVDALVDRVVQAYGGRAALASHPVVVQEGEVAAHAQADVGRVTRILARPWKLRVSIRYPGGATERRLLDGQRGWRDGREVTGSPAHAAMLLQAARMDLPFLLGEARARIVDEGEVERDGRKLRALRVPIAEGMDVTAEIEPATGRIDRAVARASAGGMPLEFRTDYADPRSVSGVLVPFREENFAQGRHTGTTTLKTVEFLPEAPTGAFQP